MQRTDGLHLRRLPAYGFSLMEVVTALSVISFALVALLGVFPIGLENSRTTVAETRAAQVARMVVATLRSEPFQAAPCFGTTTLDLATLDTLTTGDPAVLHVSYGVHEEPAIVRTDTPPADAIYRLELRFEPETFAGSSPPRVTGSRVVLRMFGMGTQQPPIFETSALIGRYQRVTFAK